MGTLLVLNNINLDKTYDRELKNIPWQNLNNELFILLRAQGFNYWLYRMGTSLVATNSCKILCKKGKNARPLLFRATVENFLAEIVTVPVSSNVG